MGQSANIIALSGGSGTANAVCKVLNLPSGIASNRLNSMIKKPKQTFYQNLRYSQFAVDPGVSQTTIVLTPFVGIITGIFFVVRPVASLKQDSAYQLTADLNISILDSFSSNCVGGQPIRLL